MSRSNVDRAAAVLYSVVFMDLLGFGIMTPLLPYLALNFGASSGALGAMTCSFSLMQMLGNVTLGALSDRFGRKRVLCACLLGSSLSYGALTFADSLQALILLRAASGFCSGTVACAQAYVTALVPKQERSHYLGYIGALIGAGFTVGPGLGALLTHYLGPQGPGLFSAGACLFNFVAGIALLVEPAPQDEPLLPKVAPEAPVQRSYSRMEVIKERAPCLPVFFSTAAYYTAFAVFECLGALDFHLTYGIGPGGFGVLQTLMGFGAVLVQRFFTRRLVAKLGEVWAGAAAHACRLAAYLLVATCRQSWAPFAMGFLVSGGSVLSPCSAALLGRLAPAEVHGTVLGLNQTFASLGRVLGPLFAAAVYSHDPESIWLVAAACSILGAGALLCVRSLLPDAHGCAAQSSAAVKTASSNAEEHLPDVAVEPAESGLATKETAIEDARDALVAPLTPVSQSVATVQEAMSPASTPMASQPVPVESPGATSTLAPQCESAAIFVPACASDSPQRKTEMLSRGTLHCMAHPSRQAESTNAEESPSTPSMALPTLPAFPLGLAQVEGTSVLNSDEQEGLSTKLGASGAAPQQQARLLPAVGGS